MLKFQVHIGQITLDFEKSIVSSARPSEWYTASIPCLNGYTHVIFLKIEAKHDHLSHSISSVDTTLQLDVTLKQKAGVLQTQNLNNKITPNNLPRWESHHKVNFDEELINFIGTEVKNYWEEFKIVPK